MLISRKILQMTKNKDRFGIYDKFYTRWDYFQKTISLILTILIPMHHLKFQKPMFTCLFLTC